MVSPFYAFIGSVLESSHPMVNSSPPSWELAAGHTQFVPPIKLYNSILQMQIQQHGYPGTVINAWQDWRTGGGIGWFRSTFATSGFLAHSRLTVHIEWGAYIHRALCCGGQTVLHNAFLYLSNIAILLLVQMFVKYLPPSIGIPVQMSVCGSWKLQIQGFVQHRQQLHQCKQASKQCLGKYQHS